MFSDPAGCDAPFAPICSDSCCVHGGNVTAADVQYGAGSSGHITSAWLRPQTLHIPYLPTHSADTWHCTAAGGPAAVEIHCALGTSEHLRTQDMLLEEKLEQFCKSGSAEEADSKANMATRVPEITRMQNGGNKRNPLRGGQNLGVTVCPPSWSDCAPFSTIISE